MSVAARPLAIANRHPRLRLDRLALARAIEILDRNASRFNPRVPGRTRPTSGRGRAAVANGGPRTAGGCPPGELSLVFLTDAALARLHADFLGDPSTTDVITFEGGSVPGNAGEICVSADTAAAFAKAHRRDFSSELTLYLVHGWLHLAGYDDLQPGEKRAMRRAEARAMNLLRAAGARPRFRLRR